MSTIGIYSITKKLPDVSVIKFTNDACEYDVNDLIKASKSYVKRKGYGFCYAHKDKKYVITCCHNIGVGEIDACANVEIYTICKSEKICFRIDKMIPEIDLAILTFCNDTYHSMFKYYNSTNISKISDIDIAQTGNTRLSALKKCDVRNIAISIDCLKSSIVPSIPLIEITCDINQDEIEGLSGSTIIQTVGKKHVLLGMITSNVEDTNILEAIPMGLIKLFVCGEHKKLSGFCFSTDFVDIDSEYEECGEYKHAHRISSTNNTSYLESSFQAEESKNFTFRKHDLIVEINGKSFNDDGTIYNDVVGCNIPLDTHIMLSHYGNENNFVDVVILRDVVNKTTKLRKQLIPLKIENMYITNIFNNYKYVYWKGCVFTELSEELIGNYDDMGLRLQGDMFENYKILSSTNKTNKTIVLIHVCYENIGTTMPMLSDNLRKMNAPLINDGNGCGLLILEKIGNKRIVDLSDLMTTLKAYSHMGSNTLSYYSPSEQAVYKFIY